MYNSNFVKQSNKKDNINSFRSRGIRLLKAVPPEMKIYYDISPDILENYGLTSYLKRYPLSPFEYSTNISGDIDSFNFHINLNSPLQILYTSLPSHIGQLLKDIPIIFDSRFLNYTLGLRMKGRKIVGISYYYYPTIPKRNRIGIKGIINKQEQRDYCQRFIDYFPLLSSQTKKELLQYFQLMTKFKGISISIFNNGKVGYKLYSKAPTGQIYSYLYQHQQKDFSQYTHYGDVALIAQRLQENKIQGYNIYYLS